MKRSCPLHHCSSSPSQPTNLRSTVSNMDGPYVSQRQMQQSWKWGHSGSTGCGRSPSLLLLLAGHYAQRGCWHSEECTVSLLVSSCVFTTTVTSQTLPLAIVCHSPLVINKAVQFDKAPLIGLLLSALFCVPPLTRPPPVGTMANLFTLSPSISDVKCWSALAISKLIRA